MDLCQEEIQNDSLLSTTTTITPTSTDLSRRELDLNRKVFLFEQQQKIQQHELKVQNDELNHKKREIELAQQNFLLAQRDFAFFMKNQLADLATAQSLFDQYKKQFFTISAEADVQRNLSMVSLCPTDLTVPVFKDGKDGGYLTQKCDELTHNKTLFPFSCESILSNHYPSSVPRKVNQSDVLLTPSFDETTSGQSQQSQNSDWVELDDDDNNNNIPESSHPITNNLLAIAMEGELDRAIDQTVYMKESNLYNHHLKKMKKISKNLQKQLIAVTQREYDVSQLTKVKDMDHIIDTIFIHPYKPNQKWYSLQYLVNNPGILSRANDLKKDLIKNWHSSAKSSIGMKVRIINLDVIVHIAMGKFENVTSDSTGPVGVKKDGKSVVEKSFVEKLWDLDSDYSITFARKNDYIAGRIPKLFSDNNNSNEYDLGTVENVNGGDDDHNNKEKGNNDNDKKMMNSVQQQLSKLVGNPMSEVKVFLSSPNVLDGSEVQIYGPGSELPSDINITLNHWVSESRTWNDDSQFFNQRCSCSDYRYSYSAASANQKCQFQSKSERMTEYAHKENGVHSSHYFPTISLRWESAKNQ